MNKKINIDDDYINFPMNNEPLECEGNQESSRLHNWIAACNFICLLNLPEQIGVYGLTMDHYKGSGLGEKTVQVSKFFSSYQKNWDVVMLPKVMHDIIFKRVVNFSEKENCNNNNKKLPTTKENMYKNYPRIADVTDSMNNTLPVSVLLLANNVYVSIDNTLLINVLPKIYIAYNSGLHYHSWEINMGCMLGVDINHVYDYICLLSMVDIKSKAIKYTNIYTLISYKYKEIDEKGNIRKNT